MTTKRPIDVRLNPKYTSIINVLNRTTKRPIDVRTEPNIYINYQCVKQNYKEAN